jgi:hypothetical protein
MRERKEYNWVCISVSTRKDKHRTKRPNNASFHGDMTVSLPPMAKQVLEEECFKYRDEFIK